MPHDKHPSLHLSTPAPTVVVHRTPVQVPIQKVFDQNMADTVAEMKPAREDLCTLEETALDAAVQSPPPSSFADVVS